MKISIFIPAYNEEENIADVVQEAGEVLSSVCKNGEIIVVNDGSRDKTGKILSDLGNKVEGLKVIHHITNEGVGASMVDGFRAATGDVLFFNSADRQAPMNYLCRMLPLLDTYDLIVAGYYQRNDSALRLFLSRGYHFLIKVLFGIKVHNVNAMKLLKKEVFDKNYPWERNLCIDTEITARAIQRGYRVGEIPLEHFPRKAGKTKVVSMNNTIKTFLSLLGLFFKLNFKRQKASQ